MIGDFLFSVTSQERRYDYLCKEKMVYSLFETQHFIPEIAEFGISLRKSSTEGCECIKLEIFLTTLKQR